ncbi:MAG: hypothetical protein U0798_20320 [Gemmataceae bacterium]
MVVKICHSDDERGIARLLVALQAIGAMYDDFIDSSLGVGLSTFRMPDGKVLTVYRDVRLVDLEGPDELVNQVVELISSNTEYTTPR